MQYPIRVAQVLGNMNTGGVESIVMNYYRAIDKTKVQFDFFLSKDSAFPQREEIENLGGRFYFLPSYTKIFKYQKTLKKILKENNYKIVHSHLSTMSIFPLFAAFRANVPHRICHNHSTASWAEPKKTLLKYILRPFNKIFSTDYFACGEKAGIWMYKQKCFNNGSVYIMNNAVDTDIFKFNCQYREEIRKEFNINPNEFVIGNVGRLCIRKNQEFLINVFKDILKQKPNAKLLLVGNGELEKKLRTQVSELNIENSVIFAGVRNDTNKFYSAFDVFCLPSNYEGLPVVVVEAACANLPIIVSQNVSDELKCFSSLKKINLVDKEWINAILSSKKRENDVHKYDIKLAAKNLQSIYINYAES